MYHYTESGLQNVWLANGYTKVKTRHGTGVAIHDVEGLHRLIGKTLAQRPKLTGAGFRFLRKEMGLSQNGIGSLVGSTEQTVSLWERRGGVPKSVDRLVRLIYLEHIGKNEKVRDLIDRLNQQDQDSELGRLTFAEHSGKWKEAA